MRYLSRWGLNNFVRRNFSKFGNSSESVASHLLAIFAHPGVRQKYKISPALFVQVLPGRSVFLPLAVSL